MKIKIVSFNIRGHNDPNGNTIAERAPRLFDAISPLSPDIIGFQEYCPKWETYIDELFSKEYELFNQYRCKTGGIEGCPILWKRERFELIKTGYFWFSDTPETESGDWDEVYHCKRITTYVILKEKNSQKSFVVMNTHYGFGDNGQIKSSRLLNEYRRKISDLPTFVIGDFNMTPDSAGYREMCSFFTDVNRVTNGDLSTTYHGYEPEKITDAHIDYCFITPDISPISQDIIKTAPNGKYPSDHFGLDILIEI